jgi:hypothetical protein
LRSVSFIGPLLVGGLVLARIILHHLEGFFNKE